MSRAARDIPSPKQLQAACDGFNMRFAVGTQVSVKMDNGEVRETVTRSEAFVMGGHSAMIQLKGISGCYSLDRVTPVTGEPA